MTTVRIKLGEGWEIQERKCVRIDCWYDRHCRHWVLYPVDAEGNQLDEAKYGFGKSEAMQMKKSMEEELIGKIY